MGRSNMGLAWAERFLAHLRRQIGIAGYDGSNIVTSDV
jgi:hypothetical protein